MTFYPEYIWFNGRIVPWAEATVHVYSELAVRGASVFDGIRTFHHEGENYALCMEEHVTRLFESAKILRFPVDIRPEDVYEAIATLVHRLDITETGFVRPTIYIDEGRYGYRASDTKMGWYVHAFPLPRSSSTTTGIRCAVSTWTRATDNVIPPRVKAGAFYQGYRLARLEGFDRGVDDVIFLNHRGTVAETTNSALFVRRGDQVVTPPLSADILESITRRKVMELLTSMNGITLVERYVTRTELYVAEEIFACGTLADIQPVIEIDGIAIGDGTPGTVTRAVQEEYFGICDSGANAPKGWLTKLARPRT